MRIGSARSGKAGNAELARSRRATGMLWPARMPLQSIGISRLPAESMVKRSSDARPVHGGLGSEHTAW